MALVVVVEPKMGTGRLVGIWLLIITAHEKLISSRQVFAGVNT